MGGNLKTHEDKYSICIAFLTYHHLLVTFNSSIGIHREQGIRTIWRVRITLRGLILLGRYNTVSGESSTRGCSNCEDER
jgi:hypothetical protein